MGATQQFSLRWNNYVHHVTTAFDNLRTDEDLVDVTLSCEGKKIYAHKMLLSACSNYFKEVFKDNPCKHPVIIFRNVNYYDLVAIIDFMYHGEVNVEQDQLSSFLTTAEMLSVQGLSVGSTSKEELRKRQPVFVESPSPLPSTVQDISQIKQSLKQPSRPLGTQNPPGPTIHAPRPTTPVSRKRRMSPPAKPTCFEREGNFKRKPREPNSVKLEVEEMEEICDEFEEEEDHEDAMIDVSQLEIPREETESPNVKTESPPSPDPNEKTGVSVPDDPLKVGQAGTSGNPEAAGQSSEEYLEEELEDECNNEECEDVIQTAYVLVDENGQVEYVDESAITASASDEDTIYIESTQEFRKSVDDSTVEFHPEKGNESDDERETAVEYIYAEGVGQNNEILIGGVPKFDCLTCDRSFKRLDSLRKHQSLHSGRTECSICGSVFSRVTHLTRHMRVKHSTWPGADTLKRTRQRKQ